MGIVHNKKEPISNGPRIPTGMKSRLFTGFIDITQENTT